MESRIEAAAERHARGYNCAQAVACTYADKVGMDETTLFKACEGLGLGMGDMEGTCGALSGACVLAGLANSTGDLTHPTSKGSTYALSRQMVTEFAHEAGATACHDLKGRETGVVLTPCLRCIDIACELVEKTLFSD
ncbi:MAG: C-GCAxxG-C-C family protein [Olsenella sp.]|jgi:C_GCAxxG_C_C family probable redox protein|nr:C-GCAxxG-C-C family protein [Olsenella sp.]